MALPILNELHGELSRIYIAGSSLALGDPRLKKYIPPLEKLGEKAPVFNTLAERLKALTEEDSARSPEALLEAGVLLYSLRYTQGTTETGEASQEMIYGETPLAASKTPYSRLNPLITQLTSGSQEHDDQVRELYESGQYQDPRLFKAYCQAITDNKTPISTYVEEVIIPALGGDMIPWVEEALDLKGGKRHARLFKILYGLKGKEILPLAEQALAEGESYIVEEAIRALGEDPKYEDLLLIHCKDKKAGPKGAAFSALARMGSSQGEAAILEGLKKATIGHLEEALSITKNPQIYQQVLAETARLIPDWKAHGAKLKILFRFLAVREEEPGLTLIEKSLSNQDFYDHARNLLDLEELLDLLLAADTPLKNGILYRIAEKNHESMVHYKLQTAIRLFSPEEVYERCHQDVNVKRHYYFWHNYSQYLVHVYHIDEGSHIPDDQKTWDRRWAEVFIKFINPYPYLELIYSLVYDDDEKTWTRILYSLLKSVKDEQSDHNTSLYGKILAQGFRNKHPKAKYFYDRLIEAGFPKEELGFIPE